MGLSLSNLAEKCDPTGFSEKTPNPIDALETTQHVGSGQKSPSTRTHLLPARPGSLPLYFLLKCSPPAAPTSSTSTTLEIAVSKVRSRGAMGRIDVLHALISDLVVLWGNDPRRRCRSDTRVIRRIFGLRFNGRQRRIGSLSHVVLNSIGTLLAMALCRSGLCDLDVHRQTVRIGGGERIDGASHHIFRIHPGTVERNLTRAAPA